MASLRSGPNALIAFPPGRTPIFLRNLPSVSGETASERAIRRCSQLGRFDGRPQRASLVVLGSRSRCSVGLAARVTRQQFSDLTKVSTSLPTVQVVQALGFRVSS